MIAVDRGQRLVTHPDIGVMLQWSSGDWFEGWSRDLLVDLPPDADRARHEQIFGRLERSEVDVVITGQQPAFLGGPLYTLYKVASTVVLAEMRSAAGHPTVPVFWSGGDDDDLTEAFRPLLYDPHRKTMLRGVRPIGHSDRMLGSMPVADVAAPEAAWLGESAHRNKLAADLTAIWQDAVAAAADEDLSWGRLQRRALLRVFHDSDLVTVCGNDGPMHGLAHELYEHAWQYRDELRVAAESRGAHLQAAGFHAQIGPTALERFLHLADKGRRQTLVTERMDRLPPVTNLRPGVALRSLVQDWLFRPAGVVVGPGELAYLKQLQPVYERFDVPRCPLLPRLFGLLAPEGLDTTKLRSSEPRSQMRQELVARAKEIGAGSSRELARVLIDSCGTEPDRAKKQATRKGERWEKAALGLLLQEYDRSCSGPGDAPPVWVRPAGQRQERIFASYGACALWGDELVAAVLHACRRHYDSGLDGNWCEFQLAVPAI